MSSSQPHRCDEFPAEYSLASCSPAELASASSASLMLQPTNPVRRANFSERQPGSFRTVSIDGVTLAAMPPQGVLTRSLFLNPSAPLNDSWSCPSCSFVSFVVKFTSSHQS